jgi:hypothetical protein
MTASIDLACGDYFGLILPRATGVVGGHAYNHPQQERVFILWMTAFVAPLVTSLRNISPVHELR